MFPRHWFRTERSQPRSQRRGCLQFDCLEDRLVPAILPTIGGDFVRVKLLGGGPAQLTVTDIGDDEHLIQVTNARIRNTLQITVIPNGGPGTVEVNKIDIQGSIGRIQAPTMNLTGMGGDLLEASGKVGRLKALTLQGGNVQVGSAGQVLALQISQVNLTATGRIDALFASDVTALDLTATSLGNLRLTRNVFAGFTGDMTASSLTLTGKYGPMKDGLTRAIIDGCVEGCTINVVAGNVGTFTTGMFCDSKLYVGYTPPMSGNFEDLGTFTAAAFAIRNFQTTDVPNPFVTPAFEDSQVVAAKLGTVRISWMGLDNGTVLFGLRVKAGVPKNVGSVRIANTPPFDALVNYKPSATGEVVPDVGGLAAQGDFRFFV